MAQGKVVKTLQILKTRGNINGGRFVKANKNHNFVNPRKREKNNECFSK